MENFFTAFSHQDSIAFLISVLIAFLIGFITAWILWGSRAARQRREAEKWKASYETSQTELVALKEQLDLKGADLVKAQREAQEASDYARRLEANKLHWQSDLDAAREEAARLQADVRSYGATVEDLNNQIIGLKARNSQLSEEVEVETQSVNQFTDMQGVFDSTDNRLSNLEASLTRLVAENTVLQSDAHAVAHLGEMQQTYEAAAVRLEALEEKLAALAAENERLKTEAQALADLTGMQQSYDSTAARLEILEAKMAALATDNDGFRTEAQTLADLTGMQQSYEAAAARLEALDAKLASIASENEVLKSELADLKGTQTSFEIAPEATVPLAMEEKTTENGFEPVEPPATLAKEDVLAAIGDKIPVATEAEKDDLTLIKGVGSFLEKKLNRLGIYTFDQISRFDDDLIEQVTAAIEFFPGRIKRDDWVGQCARLAQIKRESPESLSSDAVFLKNPQDLKIVEGVGPKIEQLLKKAGVKTLQDLANTPEERLHQILDDGGAAFQMADPSTWSWQADLAAKGEWKQLRDYQEFLVAGKNR